MQTNQFTLFLPCAGGVETFLQQEVEQIINQPSKTMLGGVQTTGSWTDILKLNLHSRLAQRVLILMSKGKYSSSNDIYTLANQIDWPAWFSLDKSFRVDITARNSPLKSLNFAALKIKDAIADKFRQQNNQRPNVDRYQPAIRVYAHLAQDELILYLDSSGESLFKRGWRYDKGAAPLKETLAAAMVVACGWQPDVPLYDPCCGSGTIVIEAAQRLAKIAPGGQRHFAFENFLRYKAGEWQQLKQQAKQQEKLFPGLIFASDVAHRMVDFAQKNAQRAGVASMIEFRGGDALQRQAPSQQAGIMLLNPPYGERINVAGEVKKSYQSAPTLASISNQTAAQYVDFMQQLAAHWKKNYTGWQAWLLVPDLQLPQKMRFKAIKRTPLWNGPIECRLFCFDIIAGSARRVKNTPNDED